MKSYCVVLLTIAVLGCSSTAGRKVETNLVGQIKEGISTKADVEKLLGPPYSRTRLVDGTEKFQWFYSEVSSTAGFGYLALMGLGTGKQEVINLFVTFRNDNVTECTLSSSKTEGQGLYAAYGVGGTNQSTVKCSELRQ